MKAMTLEITSPAGSSDTQELPDDADLVIGSSRRCQLRLTDGGIARRHAVLQIRERRCTLRALGHANRVVINGRPTRHCGPITPTDHVLVGEYALQIDIPEANATPETADISVPASVHRGQCDPDPERGESPYPNANQSDDPYHRIGAPAPALVERLRHEVAESLDLFQRDLVETLSAARIRQEAERIAWQLIENDTLTLGEDIDRAEAVALVVAETVGLGPIERLLADPAVTEVMVNGASSIYVERQGRLCPAGIRFSSEAALQNTLDRIVSPIGRRLDEGSPLVDARLPDGSRVNAVIPPLALNGPTITIRKAHNSHMTLDELTRTGAMTPAMAGLLIEAVKRRRNIVISGGTGSGKTTLLNALSGYIGGDERIITIEDSAELNLQQSHVVSLESRPANIEGSGAISIRDLVRNALRMRPDRIIVGECRGGEALDMLQAMNTGHDGSLTTAHANSPRDALSRLEVMCLMAGMDLPAQAIRDQIASAIDLIVQLSRFSDGSRRVTHITELAGTEQATILTTELFRYQAPEGDMADDVRGFQWTGQHASFATIRDPASGGLAT